MYHNGIKEERKALKILLEKSFTNSRLHKKLVIRKVHAWHSDAWHKDEGKYKGDFFFCTFPISGKIESKIFYLYPLFIFIGDKAIDEIKGIFIPRSKRIKTIHHIESTVLCGTSFYTSLTGD